MRSCPACGTLVGDTDEFCGNCGTYLGWSRPKEAEPAPPEPEGEPAPVQPARPVAPRPVRTAPVAAPVAEGTPCKVCGTPNPPGRNFCRHCAAPLTETAAAVALPWWKRLRLPRWRGGSGRLGRRLVLLVVLFALVIAGIALYPLGKEAFQDILDKTSKATPVGPSAMAVSAEVPGHPATAAIDGVSNQYWGAPGPGAWIEFSFDRPFRLLNVVVHTGASAQPEEFAKQARPTALDLVVTSSDGTVRTVPVPLLDQPGPQEVDTGISDVVRIRVVEVAVGGTGANRDVALGELEFFQRS
ncbi:NADase-type glycan-binding domain-containing protein [Amycolatopsis nigrescens]|uniref:NADase-type glycan-binding domain-containing protein n=1 Tax=Amycolatopsis nigrescens TaxID=381445 RepID=UPI000368A439|nr:zinc-ribbon domain-containing protein [Amycolatopsis nigrescens]